MEHFIEAAKTFLTDVLFKNIPQILIAILVLYVGLKLIKLLDRMLAKAYQKHQVDPSLQQFLNSLINISLKVVLVLTVMGIIGIKMTSFVAILGAAGLAVGMALQGTLQNFAGGVIILLLRPFKVGDYIEQGSYAGYVESIQIFCTTLRTYDNRNITVPNTELATKSLVNHFNLPMRRVTVSVGIAYGESVDKAREVLLSVANHHEKVLKEPKAPSVVVDSLGESSVNLLLLVWTLPENYWTVQYDMNEKVYNAFNQAGVEIPFNQLDVHVSNQ
ncbi:MAG: mechanosensitive ion channel family protein [Bacteroidales bacterium]|nr:mechanosensitive ion channel family protein [Bacteroidales bacterium]